LDPAPRNYGEAESNGETGKVESFADDTTPMGKLTETAILSIKSSLNCFANISGLKCNVEKSQIMITGTNIRQIPNYITESGFEVVDKVKILGFEITRDYNDLVSNFEKPFEKIRALVNFWGKFRLSVQGRIKIAKSLLISQLTYHCSIISLPADKISDISTCITNFIIGNMRINKNVVADPVEKGGLGFINLHEFFVSLQCSWVKQAASSQIDCWRQDLHSITGTNPTNVSPDIIDQNESPILFNLANSFYEFKKAFLLRDDNFLSSNIAGNPLLFVDRRSKIPVTVDFWHVCNFSLELINTLTVRDFFTQDKNFKTFQSLNELLGGLLVHNRYNELKNIFTGSLSIVNREKSVTGTGMVTGTGTIGEFLKKFKKGSKPFRKVLVKNRCKKLRNATSNKVKNFFKLAGLELPDEEALNFFNLEWTLGHYPPKIRDFIFKFRGNLLGLNTRVSHFNNTVDRSCTFCKLAQNQFAGPILEETFEHLFYSCPHTYAVISKFFNKFLTDFDSDTDLEKKYFIFTGRNNLDFSYKNAFLRTLSIVISYYIWECKLKKRIPMAESLYNDIFYTIDNMRKANRALSHDMQLNLHICRVWTAEANYRR
jgi:hypothetical protein